MDTTQNIQSSYTHINSRKAVVKCPSFLKFKPSLSRLIISACIILLNVWPADAQKYAVAVNTADAIALGTISIDCSYSTGRHITVNAGARINPWTFQSGSSKQFQTRHQTYYAGIRYWYWNAYSGWWTGTKAQFQEYNRGGILSQTTEEGNAYGLAINGGYSLMLSKHLNLDFGIGLWGGKQSYTEFSCPKCGRITASGKRFFILPDELIISLAWIF